MMSVINDASLCTINAMDSFSKDLEDKTEFYFCIRFFFFIHFSIRNAFHCCIITCHIHFGFRAFYSYFIL